VFDDRPGGRLSGLGRDPHLPQRLQAFLLWAVPQQQVADRRQSQSAAPVDEPDGAPGFIPSLGEEARKRLEGLGYGNIEVRIGDGYQGWPEKAPFDAIVVAAAAPQTPPALVAQLKPGGRMVIPVGGSGDIQYLKLLVKRADGGVDEKRVLPVRFVPLVPGKN